MAAVNPIHATVAKQPAAQAAQAAQTEKKKPGRPPSQKAIKHLEMVGIADTPENDANRLEFKYNCPLEFRSLFIYFKNIKTTEIHLRCNHDSLTFFARDRYKNSRIVTKIDCSKVYRYYCEGEIWIYLNQVNIEKIFSSIDKTFSLMSIEQSRTDVNSLSIIFDDFSIEKCGEYRIILSTFERDEDLYNAETQIDNKNNFPVKFTLTSKQFKKTISDASKHSDSIVCEKLGEYPLQFTYSKANFTYVEIYKNDKKINCMSTIPENTIFRCKMKLKNIKPLSASLITDEVQINCREVGDILFKSFLDNKKHIILNILTKPV